MDISRKHDIKVIEKGLKSKDPLIRKHAYNSGSKIKAERLDPYIRSAREALIRETRQGRSDNARDIRDDMMKHQTSSGFGRTSFTFSLPDYLRKK